MITNATMLELAQANQQLAAAIQKAIKEMTADPTPEFIPMKEATKLSGMDSARIRYLMRKGTVEGKKISERSIMVKRADIEKLTSCLV